MTKQQHQRAKGEIALARDRLLADRGRTVPFTEAFINASAAMLRAAWRTQQVRLATRSEITRREIRVFCSAL